MKKKTNMMFTGDGVDEFNPKNGAWIHLLSATPIKAPPWPGRYRRVSRPVR